MKRLTPILSGRETSMVTEVFVDEDQDVAWTRDSHNNVIGYTILNPKPDPRFKHILNDGRLFKLDIAHD